MAREVVGVIDAAVTAMVVPTVTFSPTAHASALIPMVFFILLAALISPTVRWRADLGQRAQYLNVQAKSVFDPISYDSSNSRDVLRFPPPRDRAANLVEHTQYFSTMHTGLFLAEALFGSGAVPGARRWCATRSSWWLRLLCSVATTLLVGAPWWVALFDLISSSYSDPGRMKARAAPRGATRAFVTDDPRISASSTEEPYEPS